MTEEAKNNLFEMCSACADTSPVYMSKSKKETVARGRKPRNRPKQDTPAATSLSSTDIWTPREEVSLSRSLALIDVSKPVDIEASNPTADADPWEPRWVVLPERPRGSQCFDAWNLADVVEDQEEV